MASPRAIRSKLSRRSEESAPIHRQKPDPRIQLEKGDITLQEVDAIVNAANSTLLGGRGVDGAIHRAAGPSLFAECRNLNGCPTGEARITQGYDLPARWVIHTVGPIWQGGQRAEAELLAHCYRSVFSIASDPEFAVQSIAFPAISAGAYGYPPHEAAHIALSESLRYLESVSSLELVRFVLFSPEMLTTYGEALAAI